MIGDYELERTWKEPTGVSFEVLNENLTTCQRKTTKTYNQGSRISGLDQTYAPQKYKFRALQLHQPARSVILLLLLLLLSYLIK
jgi:hypothetical protein